MVSGGRLSVMLFVVLLASVGPAVAQSLGEFQWQLAPLCNVVTVTVTQVGQIYRMEGTDDQCGVGGRASVIGTAFINPTGVVGLGWTLIAAPGGAPVHVSATIVIATLNGTWQDSAGRSGNLVRTTGPAAGGSPRPLTAGIGAAAVDASQVQLRIGAGCAPGNAIRTVSLDGSVTCEAGGPPGPPGPTGSVGPAGTPGSTWNRGTDRCNRAHWPDGPRRASRGSRSADDPDIHADYLSRRRCATAIHANLRASGANPRAGGRTDCRALDGPLHLSDHRNRRGALRDQPQQRYRYQLCARLRVVRWRGDIVHALQ